MSEIVEPIYDNVWSWRKKMSSAEVKTHALRGAVVELWLRGEPEGISSADFEFFVDWYWNSSGGESMSDERRKSIAEIASKIDQFFRRLYYKESVVDA